MQITSKNKIEAIHEYLIANRLDDEGDSWIFGHNPTIEEHLKTFTKEEAKLLECEIEKWEETEQYHFADPVSDSENKLIAGNYIYGQIFLSIQDFEKLEYLIQNLVIIIRDNDTKRAIQYYENILEKVKVLNESSTMDMLV